MTISGCLGAYVILLFLLPPYINFKPGPLLVCSWDIHQTTVAISVMTCLLEKLLCVDMLFLMRMCFPLLHSIPPPLMPTIFSTKAYPQLYFTISLQLTHHQTTHKILSLSPIHTRLVLGVPHLSFWTPLPRPTRLFLLLLRPSSGLLPRPTRRLHLLPRPFPAQLPLRPRPPLLGRAPLLAQRPLLPHPHFRIRPTPLLPYILLHLNFPQFPLLSLARLPVANMGFLNLSTSLTFIPKLQNLLYPVTL